MELIFGYFISKETSNYSNYQKIKKFVSNKKYWNIDINSDWFENYILKEVNEDDLRIWIRNVFNYNKSSSKKDNYYIPIELEDIPRSKMVKWVSYNLYFKCGWQLTENEIEHSERILGEIEKKIDFKFNDIYNNSIYFLKFGTNKIECSYRSYILSSCFGMLKDLCYFSLYLFDFDKYSIKNTNIVYFHYGKHEKGKTTIFIHGLGFGIEPYLYYILRLRRKMNLIIIILPNISNMECKMVNQKIVYDDLFPEYETWRSVIKFILERHHINEINVIAHSFGTVIMGLLLKDKWIKKK